jgi:hypothetical protein
MSKGTREIVGNCVVGEWEGDMFIHRTQDTHRKRTYVFLDGTLRVTVGSETREMIPPSKRECAA